MLKRRDFQSPLIGASIGPGVGPVQDFIRLKLGNIILARLPDDREQAIAMMRLCREQKIYVLLPEIVQRHNHRRWFAPSLTKADVENAAAAAGEYFLGRYAIGESGGILYWPKFYTINEAAQKYRNMPPCRSNSEARRTYVEYLRKELEFERTQVADLPLFNVDSSIVFGYHTEAGIDGQCLEMLPGDPLITLAAVRGAARAANQIWGVHIAQLWYGGMCLDETWLKRWRTSLYLSYLAGADFIFPESGHYEYMHAQEPYYGFDAPEIKKVRDELRQLRKLALIHRRPDSGPETPLAIVRGNDDGHPGIWNPYAWGIYDCGEKWESSDEERGWELFDALYTREPLFHPTVTGKFDPTGNPPAGTADIVPADGDFSRYRALIFTGVNTMDEKLYNKLTEYVRNGGHLLIWLTHFDTEHDRGEAIKLFRDGDLSELCGFKVTGKAPSDVRGLSIIRPGKVPGYRIAWRDASFDPVYNSRVTGAELEYTSPDIEVIAGLSDELRNKNENVTAAPLLVEHRLGKGAVHTVTVFDAPGSAGLREFAKYLLWMEVRSHTAELDLLAGDRVRYAVYDADGGKNLYFYNTDTDLMQGAVPLYQGKKSGQIPLQPGEFRIAYFREELLLLPEDSVSDLRRNDDGSFRLIGGKQSVVLLNLGETVRNGSINGVRFALPPGGEIKLEIPEEIPEELAPYFAPEFLEEPEITPCDLSTPY